MAVQTLVAFLSLLVFGSAIQVPATQSKFQQLLDKTTENFMIQSVKSGKFLTYKYSHDYLQPAKKPLEVFTSSDGTAGQVWRLQQGIGFPFRNGSFTVIHSIQAASQANGALESRKPSISLNMWRLVPVARGEDKNIFRIVKPFKPEDCLVSDHPDGSLVAIGNCEDASEGSLWRLIHVK